MSKDKGEPNPCDGGGMCCMHMATPPFIDPAAYRRYGLNAWIESPRRKWQDEQPCVWLNQITGKCRHYKLRPSVCREFVPGGDGCNKIRASVGLPAITKGTDQ